MSISCKMAVLGDSSVGKSSIAVRWGKDGPHLTWQRPRCASGRNVAATGHATELLGWFRGVG